MLTDRYGRPLSNLRVTVTHDCNYSCLFCHREGEPLGGTFTFKPEHFRLMVQAAYSLGVKQVKLTGGEPLLRRDIVEIAEELSSLGKKDLEVSITTNGFLLVENASRLSEAGVSRVNVSLHSLERNTYKLLTGRDSLSKALAGVDAAIDAGLGVKLNFVLTWLNAREVPRLLDFASSKGVNVNLIELIPLGGGHYGFSELYMPVEMVLPHLEKRSVSSGRRELHNRPVYVLDTGVKVEVIANYLNPSFCLGCSRVRFTHDGKLKVCLYRDNPAISVRDVLLSKLPEDEKLEKLEEALIEANSLREPYFRLENGVVKTADGQILGPPREL
ncbi:MAG: GTP 3',8-cyclase MoaA [Thermofilum sp.]